MLAASLPCFRPGRCDLPREDVVMIGVLFCALVSLGIFALAALADERWPDRLTRRGEHLRGQRWQGQWGPRPSYAGSRRAAVSMPRLRSPSFIGH